jgi:hypothetical protein
LFCLFLFDLVWNDFSLWLLVMFDWFLLCWLFCLIDPLPISFFYLVVFLPINSSVCLFLFLYWFRLFGFSSLCCLFSSLMVFLFGFGYSRFLFLFYLVWSPLICIGSLWWVKMNKVLTISFLWENVHNLFNLWNSTHDFSVWWANTRNLFVWWVINARNLLVWWVNSCNLFGESR